MKGVLNKDEYIKNILEIAELGTFLADLDGNCLFVNQEWEKIYGLKSQCALDKGWMANIVPGDIPIINTNIYHIDGPTKIADFTYRINHPEKGERFLKTNFRQINLNGKTYFAGYIKDETDLKTALQELKDVNEQLVKSNRDKDRLMKTLIHDLKNPIDGICSLTAMILEEDLQPEVNDMLRLVHDSCSYSSLMIRDLVEAILNNHEETIQKTEADLQLLLQQCTRLLQVKADEKDLRLILEADQRIIAIIDPEKIARVIYNLVSNAIKFSSKQSVITIKLIQLEKKIRITVQDNGIGIPPNYKDKLFDTFTETKRFGTAQEQPFGLGLSICKQIIKAHRGKIWYDSKPDEGTNFYFELPGC